MEKLNVSGIYKLWFEDPDKCYIGSAKNIETRLKNHVSDLMNKNHQNNYLQNAFNRLGLFNMKWEILEICNENPAIHILKRESFYIEQYKSNITGYNKAIFTTHPKTKIAYMSSDINYKPEYSKVVEEFKSKFNIILIEMKVGILKDENINYSKSWYQKSDKITLTKFITNVYTYMRNNNKESMMNSMVSLPSYNQNTLLQDIVADTAQGKLSKIIRKQYMTEFTKNVNSIGILSCFNPLHLEMHKMRKEDSLDLYRVYSFIRSLENVPLEENITLHVPTGIYSIFSRYLG